MACEKIIEEELALLGSEKERMRLLDIDVANRLQNELYVEEIKDKEQLQNEDLQPPPNDHVYMSLKDFVGSPVNGWEDVNQ